MTLTLYSKCPDVGQVLAAVGGRSTVSGEQATDGRDEVEKCVSTKKGKNILCMHCVNLRNFRKNLLPLNPTLENCSYGNVNQLKKTSKFHIIASRVERA